MTIYMVTRGSIVLAYFTYTDFRQVKVRPALVVSNDSLLDKRGDIIIAAISSKSVKDSFEVSLANWRSAGLRFPSKVVACKLVTVNAKVVTKIGNIHRDDLLAVEPALRSALLLAGASSISE